MKWITRIVILAIVALVVFFAFFRSDKINLEGNWTTEKLVLDGKPATNEYLGVKPPTVINGWENSITFPKSEGKVVAGYEISKKEDDLYIELQSSDKVLNGVFQLSIDTLILGPRNYRVYVSMRSEKAQIELHREVYIEPVEPEFPRKGKV